MTHSMKMTPTNGRASLNLLLFLSKRFLMLAENEITKIENLKFLNSLMFLDLSDNKIEDFDPGKSVAPILHPPPSLPPPPSYQYVQRFYSYQT